MRKITECLKFTVLLSDKMSSVYNGTRSVEKFQEIKWIICKDCGTD